MILFANSPIFNCVVQFQMFVQNSDARRRAAVIHAIDTNRLVLIYWQRGFFAMSKIQR